MSSMGTEERVILFDLRAIQRHLSKEMRSHDCPWLKSYVEALDKIHSRLDKALIK